MPCRFEDHPTVPVTSVHSLVAIARNGWSRSIGTFGRNQLEQVVAITRCAQRELIHHWQISLTRPDKISQLATGKLMCLATALDIAFENAE